jgi:ATP/maltotriose-dependent transcriptional regulator MalT
VNLQFSLTYLARTHLLTGELAAAARLIDEDYLIAEATGNPMFEYAALMLAAWRGDEARAEQLAGATARQGEGDLGVPATFVACARAVLSNGLGQHDAARAAVRPMFLALQSNPAAYVLYSPLIVPELAEAAYRMGDVNLVGEILDWLAERTRVTPTDWALGIEARIRAFLSEEAEADQFYRESAERLRRTRLRAELARSQLLHGEWLRGQQRHAEARDQLRAAHEALAGMGMRGFAERARRELAAAGEIIRERPARNADGAPVPGNALTPQEAQVARLAREGLSNPEIAARLFISARTVSYHLSKVFAKLGISSRRQLHQVL